MDIGDRFRVIGLAVAWVIWSLVCLFWTIDIAEDDFGMFAVGVVIHLGFYVVSAFLLFGAGAWFLEDGADELGKWWMARKARKELS